MKTLDKKFWSFVIGATLLFIFLKGIIWTLLTYGIGAILLFVFIPMLTDKKTLKKKK